MFKDYSLNRLLALFVTTGFGFLLLDSILEHWNIFAQEIMAFVPAVFSLWGLLAGSIAVVRWDEKSIRWLQVTLIAGIVVSGIGSCLHAIEEGEGEMTVEMRARSTGKGQATSCSTRVWRACCSRTAWYLTQMAG